MSNEIATKEQHQTAQEIELDAGDVKQYIAQNATDKELYFFMNIAKSFGLNPFKKEIHFVKYGSQPGQTIVGYETYIKRAERTGLLDGWSVWVDKDNIGEKAVIQINRKDRNHSFIWEVYRKEFDKQQSTWKAMPYFMLKKVAISQGFRLAFPEEVGGMPYTPDEINLGQSENLGTGEVHNAEYTEQSHNGNSQSTQQKKGNNSKQGSGGQSQKQNMSTQEQQQALASYIHSLGFTDKQGKIDWVNAWLEPRGYELVNSSKELTKDTISQMIEQAKKEVEEKAQPAEQDAEQIDEDPFKPEAEATTE